MKSHTEVEARWINLDPKEIVTRLEKAGAKKTGSHFFREWVFAYPEWRAKNRRIRVRTDGDKTWLTYKSSSTWTVDGTEEIEVITSSAEDTVSMIKAIDVPLLRYQEKKRDTYEIGDITYDVDFWPKIPMVLEIESDSEEKVRKGAKLIGLEWKDAIFEDQAVVHSKYFGIDLFAISDYHFE